MVPAYLEHLAAIPMTTSDKADRKALPAPTTRRSTSTGEHVPAETATERVLADALAAVLGVDEVSVVSNFFDDLGANSLLMAQFSAKVRKTGALPATSMREIYQHPTIRSLALLLGGTAPATADPAATGTVVRTSSVRYVLTGAAQLLIFLGLTYLSALLIDIGFTWAAAGVTPLKVFERSSLYVVALLLLTCVLPILAKWLLIGRFKPREIRLWSLGYLRFWTVKTLIRASPLALFPGSPVYVLYLRALGMKIGKGTTILSTNVPVATDLISIGANSVIRRGASFTGYHAVGGKLVTGRITLGRDVFVGETSVLDIGTAMGDGAQLGHSSSLHTGQLVPAGASWHGVPAEPTTTNYNVVQPFRMRGVRRFLFGTAQLIGMLVLVPVVSGVVVTLLTAVPVVATFFDPARLSFVASRYYVSMVVISAILFFGFALLGLLAMIILPRLLTPLVRPGRTYRLYGFHYLVAQAITRLGNSRFFMLMFGDSSAAVGYAKSLGYNLGVVEQTGSNFGTEISHDSALLTTVGTGTMLSDGLVIMNSDFSHTSFKMSRIAIGERNFMGNNIALPADAKIGRNVLLGTKVMVPIDGPIREDVGLLGSPPFEIPRSVARDSAFDELKRPEVLRKRLRAKARHNVASMIVFLVYRWLQVLAVLLIMTAAAALYSRFGHFSVAIGLLAVMTFNMVFVAFAERAVMGFRRLTPRFVSIYDPYFWRHERLWKVLAAPLFSGTPFKSLSWRLLGVRVGKRLFDDGAGIPEKTLVTLGDDVVLNAGSVIQGHSLEDGTFKSDYIKIGSGVVLGVSAFVHYGVTMGDGTVLESDAFLMKGEETAPFTRWAGNPATEVRPEVVAFEPLTAPIKLPLPSDRPIRRLAA
jgi:non-ribosomal peptide synthetase-like protein